MRQYISWSKKNNGWLGVPLWTKRYKRAPVNCQKKKPDETIKVHIPLTSIQSGGEEQFSWSLTVMETGKGWGSDGHLARKHHSLKYFSLDWTYLVTFHLLKPPKSLSKKEIEIFRIDCHVYYDIPGLITLTKDFDNYNILNRWFPKLPLSKFAHETFPISLLHNTPSTQDVTMLFSSMESVAWRPQEQRSTRDKAKEDQRLPNLT